MSTEVAHGHEYDITCRICGQIGHIALAIEPASALPAQPSFVALVEALERIGYTEIRDTVTERNPSGWTLRGKMYEPNT